MAKGLIDFLEWVRDLGSKKNELNKTQIIPKEKKPNKVRRNKWGFPLMRNDK